MPAQNSEGFPSRWTNEQFDGSRWRQYETDDAIILLTAVGRSLAAKGGLSKAIRAYRDDFIAGTEGPEHTRQPLASGGNAKVFSVNGDQLAIKEARLDPGTDQLWPAMLRMDRLKGAIESHSPHWVGLPKQYGLLVPLQNPRQQFMLMEKIDSGVTVGDIINYPDDVEHRPADMPDRVRREFGHVTPELQDEIGNRFETLKATLRAALVAEDLSSDKYLPDIDNNEFNVLVEPLDAPVAGSNHKFWVIDQ